MLNTTNSKHFFTWLSPNKTLLVCFFLILFLLSQIQMYSANQTFENENTFIQSTTVAWFTKELVYPKPLDASRNYESVVLEERTVFDWSGCLMSVLIAYLISAITALSVKQKSFKEFVKVQGIKGIFKPNITNVSSVIFSLLLFGWFKFSQFDFFDQVSPTFCVFLIIGLYVLGSFLHKVILFSPLVAIKGHNDNEIQSSKNSIKVGWCLFVFPFLIVAFLLNKYFENKIPPEGVNSIEGFCFVLSIFLFSAAFIALIVIIQDNIASKSFSDFTHWSFLIPLTCFFIVFMGLTFTLPMGVLSDEGMYHFMEGDCDWGGSNVFFFIRLGLLFAVNLAFILGNFRKIKSPWYFLVHFLSLLTLWFLLAGGGACEGYYANPNRTYDQSVLEIVAFALFGLSLFPFVQRFSRLIQLLITIGWNALYVILFYFFLLFAPFWTWTHSSMIITTFLVASGVVFILSTRKKVAL